MARSAARPARRKPSAADGAEPALPAAGPRRRRGPARLPAARSPRSSARRAGARRRVAPTRRPSCSPPSRGCSRCSRATAAAELRRMGRRRQPPGAARPRGGAPTTTGCCSSTSTSASTPTTRPRCARFLATDAIPRASPTGCSCTAAWGDRVDPEPRYVYRLFARRPEMTPAGGAPAPEPGAARDRAPGLGADLDPRPPPRVARAARAAARQVRARRPRGRAPRPHRDDARAGPRAARRLAAAARRRIAVVGGAKAPPAAGGRRASEPADDRPLLVCLLAVRNGAADLAGYLESAARFADAVVALDDGSTDATAELLARGPAGARSVIRNPRRESYAGWDDAANRQALLDACAELGPRWVAVPRRRRAHRSRRRRRAAGVRRAARPCPARPTGSASTG